MQKSQNKQCNIWPRLGLVILQFTASLMFSTIMKRNAMNIIQLKIQFLQNLQTNEEWVSQVPISCEEAVKTLLQHRRGSIGRLAQANSQPRSPTLNSFQSHKHQSGYWNRFLFNDARLHIFNIVYNKNIFSAACCCLVLSVH